MFKKIDIYSCENKLSNSGIRRKRFFFAYCAITGVLKSGTARRSYIKIIYTVVAVRPKNSNLGSSSTRRHEITSAYLRRWRVYTSVSHSINWSSTSSKDPDKFCFTGTACCAIAPTMCGIKQRNSTLIYNLNFTLFVNYNIIITNSVIINWH